VFCFICGGIVMVRNDAFDVSFEMVNSDFYGEGWMFEIWSIDFVFVEGFMDVVVY